MKRATRIFLLIVVVYILAVVAVAYLFDSQMRPLRAGELSIPDGSVIFWKDGPLSKPIYRNTGSHLTHAAIVLNGFVYEATPPRVSKTPLKDYIKDMESRAKQGKKGFTWLVMKPKLDYSPANLDKMVEYAETQIGRPYMLRGWWKGREVRGIFCSQLVSDILERGGRIKSAGVKESPGSLAKRLEPIYD